MSTAINDLVTRPALRYFGGKWALAPWIVPLLPPHTTYVEPFCGAASILLRKEASTVEVLNDRAAEVVNFFRILREQPDALIGTLELTPYAEDEFQAAEEPCDDPLERARRFFVRSWQGFGGASTNANFRGLRRCAYRDIAGQCAGAVDNLTNVAARLRGVTIENVDWFVAVAKYDRRGTLFYVDPPYLMRTRSETRPSKGYGENEITAAEHMRILDTLCAAKGSVVISGYADPLYDLRLGGWERHERGTKGIQNHGRTEVIWIRRSP